MFVCIIIIVGVDKTFAVYIIFYIFNLLYRRKKGKKNFLYTHTICLDGGITHTTCLHGGPHKFVEQWQ